MRLTTHTDYALRMLIFLALRDGERVTIRDVAEAYSVSRNHLMKVAHALQKAGYLIGSRGKGGGLRLAQAPASIRLGDVVRAMEMDLTLAECFGTHNACVIAPHCRLKRILAESLDQFFDSLNCYTLADISRPTRGLRRALKIATNTRA